MTIFYKITHDTPDGSSCPTGREYEQAAPAAGARRWPGDPDERYPTAAELRRRPARVPAEASRLGARAEPARPSAAERPATVARTRVAASAVAHRRPPGGRRRHPPPVSAACRRGGSARAPAARAPPIDCAALPADARDLRGRQVGPPALHPRHGAAQPASSCAATSCTGTSDVDGEHLGNVLVRYGLLTQARPGAGHARSCCASAGAWATVLDELGIMSKRAHGRGGGPARARDPLQRARARGRRRARFEETGEERRSERGPRPRRSRPAR